MIDKSDISVIICTHTEKRLGDLIDAISSVREQTCLPLEIIIVVDHNDVLLQAVRNCFPEEIVIGNNGSIGASASRNCGVDIASGKIIAFMDDDAVADRDWLQQLYAGYQNESILGVGGEMKPLWLVNKPRWLPEEFYWIIGANYKGLPNKTTSVRNLWTGNFSVRRDVFYGVNGFRTGFGKVGNRSSPEDTDFCIRVLQHFPSGVLIYKPDAKVGHKVFPNRANYNFFMKRCLNEGLGKAQLSKLVGRDKGMSTERSYMIKTLPCGFIKGFSDTFFHADLYGIIRSGNIVLGLLAAGLGFVWGTTETRTSHYTVNPITEPPDTIKRNI
jgi:glycosyltransferase involved in cell wall biosynthesis